MWGGEQIVERLGKRGVSEDGILKSRVRQLSHHRDLRGFIKAVVDADTNRILGCAVLGIEGGELMSMLEIAMITPAINIRISTTYRY